MSLAKRLSAVVPARSNRGCETCKWVDSLPPEDQQAFKDWVAQERSLTQLWQIATTTEPNPLKISITGMRACIRVHFTAQDADQ